MLSENYLAARREKVMVFLWPLYEMYIVQGMMEEKVAPLQNVRKLESTENEWDCDGGNF